MDKVAELIALDKAMYEAVERHHLRTVPQEHVLVLGLSPQDWALISCWGNDLPTPMAYSKNVLYWGVHQVIEDATVPEGACRVLVSAESIEK